MDPKELELPQTLKSLLSGASAVVSLYVVLWLTKLVGFLPKDFSLSQEAWVLVFAVFAIGDSIYSKKKKPKHKKRKRRYSK